MKGNAIFLLLLLATASTSAQPDSNMGTALTDAVTPLLGGLNEAIKPLLDSLSQVFQPIAESLKDLELPDTAGFDNATEALDFSGLDFSGLLANITTAFNFSGIPDLGKMFEGALGLIPDTIEGLIPDTLNDLVACAGALARRVFNSNSTEPYAACLEALIADPCSEPEACAKWAASFQDDLAVDGECLKILMGNSTMQE
jgi:hypothetical protein